MPPETCQCAAWASIPSWEQRVRCGRVGAAAQVRCVSVEVLYERCAVPQLAAGTLRHPRTVRQKGPCEGPRTRVWGEPAIGFLRCTAAGAGWRSLCSSWSCCTAAVRVPGPPPPRTRARGVRESKRASSARIPRGGTGAGGGRERRWRTAGKGATPRRGCFSSSVRFPYLVNPRGREAVVYCADDIVVCTCCTPYLAK